MALRPYRDDPESASSNIAFRRRGPVIELLEMRPMPISTEGQNRSASLFSGKRYGAKMFWLLFVLLVCIYAVSRYEPAPVDEAHQGLAPSASIQKEQQHEEDKHETPVEKKSPARQICGRKIPFDLFDTSTWPTPYTPSYFEQEPTNSEKAMLIRKDEEFDFVRIRSINEFFSALDMAYEEKREIYVTKDASWLWDAFQPFVGDKVERDDEFWNNMRDALDVTIVNDEAEAKQSGKMLEVFSPKQLYEAKTLTATQLRNRRDTIFRKLLRLSPAKPGGNICFTINLCGLTNINSYHYGTNYIVIDLSPTTSKKWQQQFDDVSGRDHSGAYEMTPEYVKSILKPLKLHTKTIFMMGDHSTTEDEEIKRLMEDPELRTVQAVKEDDDYDHSDMLHLAVLADVYMADPTSQWSLMIARMRFALGFTNTFVLTESKIDENGQEQWVSYIDPRDYLELYDREHLGLWMG